MDCCGMPLAVRAGGGFVCRRCQAEYGVPVGASLNRCAAAASEAPNDLGAVVNVVVPDPEPVQVVQPKVSGFGRGGGRKGGPK